MSANSSGRVLCVVSFCAAVAAGVPAARADLPMPFVENWNAEAPGDRADQLTWWAHEGAYGGAPAGDAVIVPLGGGDNALDMNPSGSESMGIRSDSTLFGAPLLWMETDMQLTADGAGAGVIGFCQAAAALNGYALAVSRDGTGGAWVDLRKFDGDLNDSFTVGPVNITTLDPTQRHTYRLEAAFSAGQIAFSVLVDGSPLTSPNLNPVDTDPHGFSGGLRFALASNFGQQAYFDDFQALPEPATFCLLTLGGAVLLCRRRRS